MPNDVGTEILETVLKIKAEAGERCGMKTGIPCVRPKGHWSPVSPCFIIHEGFGYYIYQDSIDRVSSSDRWPDDLTEGLYDKKIQDE